MGGSTVTAGPVVTSAAALVVASAANISGWHDANLRSLGYATEWTDGAWLTPDSVPVIFFNAITMRPGASGTAIAGRVRHDGWVSVYDPWADTGLDELGFHLDGDHAWMVRQPGPLPATRRPRRAVAAGRPVHRARPHRRRAGRLRGRRGGRLRVGRPVALHWHGPPLLDDARMHLWRGRVGDRTGGRVDGLHGGRRGRHLRRGDAPGVASARHRPTDDTARARG